MKRRCRKGAWLHGLCVLLAFSWAAGAIADANAQGGEYEPVANELVTGAQQEERQDQAAAGAHQPPRKPLVMIHPRTQAQYYWDYTLAKWVPGAPPVAEEYGSETGVLRGTSHPTLGDAAYPDVQVAEQHGDGLAYEQQHGHEAGHHQQPDGELAGGRAQHADHHEYDHYQHHVQHDQTAGHDSDRPDPWSDGHISDAAPAGHAAQYGGEAAGAGAGAVPDPYNVAAPDGVALADQQASMDSSSSAAEGTGYAADPAAGDLYAATDAAAAAAGAAAGKHGALDSSSPTQDAVLHDDPNAVHFDAAADRAAAVAGWGSHGAAAAAGEGQGQAAHGAAHGGNPAEGAADSSGVTHDAATAAAAQADVGGQGTQAQAQQDATGASAGDAPLVQHTTNEVVKQLFEGILQPSTAPSPLGELSVQQVDGMVEASQGMLFANTSARNISKGLAGLREVHKLVETRLPSAPRVRKLREEVQQLEPAADQEGAAAQQQQQQVTSVTEEVHANGGRVIRVRLNLDGGQEQGLQSAATFQPPPERKLALEVDDNRKNGLDAAAAATFQLAALQASGIVPEDQLPRDPAAALATLHQAARAGSLEALMALTDRYVAGAGVEASCSLGMVYGKLAGQYLAADVETHQRFAAPLMPVGLRDRHADGAYVAAHDVENGEEVISLEEDQAMRGNIDAQRRMAYRRLIGRGIDADPEGAYHDFVAAAQQGDANAIFNLGYMHLRGLFVPQNYTAAKEFFEQAAAKELPAAYNGLGVLYWNGQGVPANLTAARLSFEQGAVFNNSDCIYNLATMHYFGVGVTTNQTIAVELFLRAYDHGHWRAPYMLALAYEGGAGVEANCTKAQFYIRRFFADRSAWSDELTTAVKKLDAGDAWGALATYITVAEQGSTAAAANAAWMLRRGIGYKGADKDIIAARYLLRAAKQGHAASMVELGHMVLQGLADVDVSSLPKVVHPANATATATAANTTSDGGSEPAASAGGQAAGVAAASAADAPVASGSAAAASGAGPGAQAPSATTTTPTSDASQAADGLLPATDQAASPTSSEPSAASSAAAAPTTPSQTVSGASGNAAVVAAAASTAVAMHLHRLPGNATRAAAWYKAAAAAGDIEGLFYWGWVHHFGIGVPENGTLAEELYIKAFDRAGITSPQSLAPLLALTGLRIDRWLAPLLGPHALARAYYSLVDVNGWVLHGLRRSGFTGWLNDYLRTRRQAAAAGTGAGAAGTGTGGAAAGPKWTISSGRLRVPSLQQVLQWLGKPENMERLEDVSGLILLAMLVGVLWVRRRRLRALRVTAT